MYFKVVAIIAALAAVVAANPAPAEALDCVRLPRRFGRLALTLIMEKQVTVQFPATCPAAHPLNCNGAGGITLCCTVSRPRYLLPQRTVFNVYSLVLHVSNERLRGFSDSLESLLCTVDDHVNCKPYDQSVEDVLLWASSFVC